jgi:protein involved in polysaccharide export with SLBB domain
VRVEVNNVWRIIALLAVLWVAACGGNPYSRAPMKASALPPDLVKTVPFELGSGDKLRVTVFGADQLGGEYEVDLGGALSLPLIGVIPAAGKNLDQVKAEIAQRLRDRKLMNDPQVTVTLVSARPFYILGEVQKPGEYPYQGGLDIVSAIATAGGFSYRADQNYVFVRRAGARDEIQVPLSSALPIGPGDVVRVPGRSF